MKQTREIKSFIFSQYFSDGLRITFGVLLPSLLLFQLDQVEIGLTLSLGAFCVSIPDNPGPVVHRRNGMLFCCVFIFLVSLLTAAINYSPFLLGIEILVFCFFFSMFSVFGSRASALGTAVLFVMILTIDEQIVSGRGLWMHSLYILLGGIWYTVLSISLVQLRPYRLSQQALGECIREIAHYVRLKGNFYDVSSELSNNYKELIDQQVVVNLHQDSVRELLFKSRLMIKESTRTGRLLILVFVDILDLFEQTMATHYDYQQIRNVYWKTDTLNGFKRLIHMISEELENLSYSIISNERPFPKYNFTPELEKLKLTIDSLEVDGMQNMVLKKTLINIRNMVNRTQKIYSHFNPSQLGLSESKTSEDYTKFVTHQNIDPKLFKENLTFKSSTFRHAVRVAIMCFIGFLVSKLFPLGHHSYWILLTILVILKPAYSLTKKRNAERLAGTIIGGIAGATILIFIGDRNILFVLLLLFMIGAFSFQRLNYVVSVLFMTPYSLILFSFLGENNITVAQERIVDTLVGSVIAFSASFIILPNWEFPQLKKFMKEVLIANYNYLRVISDRMSGKPMELTSYKLARKDVYIKSANLASAFQRMISEPKSKQQNTKDVHKFVVLNHILSSYIATLITNVRENPPENFNDKHVKLLRKTLNSLTEVIRYMGESDFSDADMQLKSAQATLNSPAENDYLFDQLNLIHNIVQDIQKLSMDQTQNNLTNPDNS